MIKKIRIFFFFSWSISWPSSCFLTLFSFKNSHLRSALSNQISTKWLNSWIILKRKEDYVYLTSNSSVLSPSSYIMRFSILSQLHLIPNITDWLENSLQAILKYLNDWNNFPALQNLFDEDETSIRSLNSHLLGA